MKNIAYYNGKISTIEDMSIPLNDRSHYFGDGVYDATIASQHRIYLLEDHINRFFNSMSLVNIQPDFSKAWLAELLAELALKVDSSEQFVYFQVSRGTAIRNHAYDLNIKPNLTVYITPSTSPKTILTQSLKVQTEPDIRFELCHIKTLNLLPNVMSTQRAQQKGLDETIYHRQGRVTECAHSNVHIIQKGRLKTAPTDHWILPGIARKHLLMAAKRLGIPCDETAFNLDELFNAEEVIITSSSHFCSQVTEIDGKGVGGRNEQLLQALQAATYQEFQALI
ncbi:MULTISPECIES: aminotransferase class IV [unclassified Enterococcus]|uniref:aminotransferase class IV n=1 Tax=unclassified Enterococcus TaxID=2608891 RepID=UPI001555BFA5|nr:MULTISPECIES: aminotransferase class IV [unclassified Enterococcus]MBS7578118.1 aminotransferase class IV [Enterococcus sp. MMGLQ5-2]MBS7585378.1 aminotransferase class IV [Enterococcus sp. MMGLQ5-1]NPD13235.1 D-amino acid aminotransferase [Enterococcus sp. MMGLQ5-1]NPD37949.1 D-amino acid aminotransferase [Enterococcus sp. MMGLQ5-2]